MGTNYYADWNPPGAERVTVRLHICKSFTMFNGLVFPRWGAWRAFLLYNATRPESGRWFTGQGDLVIVDEYDDRWAVDRFITEVESTTQEQRRRQTQWVIDHQDHIFKYDPDVDYFDPDGFSFHRGEFF